MTAPSFLSGADLHPDAVVTSVDVRLLELPMRQALAADHSTTSSRPLTVIGLCVEIPSEGSQWAWGESAALPTAGYSPESAQDSFEALRAGASQLVGCSPAALIGGDRKTSAALGAMSAAAVEMAALDAVGDISHRSLAQLLGSTKSRTPAGAAVGLGSVDDVVSTCERLVNDGYRRIKLKIQPSNDIDVATKALAAISPAVDWHVDANGSYTDDDETTMIKLAELGIGAIEQPFAVNNPDAASRLVAELANRGLNCLVVADEAAIGEQAIEHLHDRQAATAVTIKPSRYRGLSPTLAVIERCQHLGMSISVGGMIESALGRRALAALAGLSAFTVTGDLSPSRRWMTVDPWPDLAVARTGPNGDLTIEVPTDPGVAPPPNIDVLDSLTKLRHHIT